MKREQLNEMYKKYNLDKEDDFFKTKQYTIITRSGIDKIQAIEKIVISYEVINCEKTFCVVKATGTHNKISIQTFGSALKGAGFKDGNTISWYVMEMAEKRAMSRAVLKLTGFYELGVFGEDESEDFKRTPATKKPKQENSRLQQVIDWCKDNTDMTALQDYEAKLGDKAENKELKEVVSNRINELI